MEKKCSKCGQVKELSQFAKSTGKHGGKNGLRAYCKACANEYMKSYYNETANGRFRRLRDNALKQGISFNIKREEFESWFTSQQMECHYCHTPVEFNYSRKLKLNGYTIDRLNPQLGYETGNITLACRRCNMIKGNWFSPTQMLEIASKYLRG